MDQPADILEAQADRAVGAGDARTAAQLLEQAVAQDGGKPELWAKLSALRRALGDDAGALQAIERTLALSPLDFSALLARAVLLERARDPRADEAFTHAVAQA